jgi:hypothetical protein
LDQWVHSGQERVHDAADRRVQINPFLQFQDQFTQALVTSRQRWLDAWTAQQSANGSATQLLALIEDTP